jgi:Family of unknown function (DUF6941)
VKLDFIMLADEADAAGHKLYIHGAGLRRIDAPELPWRASVAVAAQFSAALDEAGNRHDLRAQLTAPSGALMAELPQFPIQLPPTEEIPPDWEELALVAVIKLEGIPFQEEGWHLFRFTLDEQPLDEIRMRIVRTDSPTSGQEATPGEVPAPEKSGT